VHALQSESSAAFEEAFNPLHSRDEALTRQFGVQVAAFAAIARDRKRHLVTSLAHVHAAIADAPAEAFAAPE